MPPTKRTYRELDGERIEGTWRPIFIHNGPGYFVTDLIIYADGVIDCWGHISVVEFAQKLKSGWATTSVPDGGRASVHHLGLWELTNPGTALDAEGLFLEVLDEIERLNDRPDSSQRCLTALDAYLRDPTSDRLGELREAYAAIPIHLRMYVLGDQDAKDWPLRRLMTDVGERMGDSDEVMTEESRQHALAYFARHASDEQKWRERPPADGDEPRSPAITLPAVVYPQGWPEEPGLLVLRNDYPAAIELGPLEFPSVSHAYWASSTFDESARQEISEAANEFEAQQIAERSTTDPSWPAVRLSTMAAFLRVKYSKYPDFEEALIGTGDSKLLYHGIQSVYWTTRGNDGQNWIGRLLELVRSERAAARAGLAPNAPR